MATLIGDGGHATDIADTLLGLYVQVPHHDLFHQFSFDGSLYIGINDPHTRDRVARELGIFDEPWTHPNAYIGTDVRVGVGTHINYGVTMTRTTIGHHTTISPGVTICGDVTIGDRVFIGAGSTIKNLVTIGSDAFIPMGSIVVRDVAEGERYKR